MESIFDPLALSRAQFSLKAMFHIIWPVLGIGLSLFIAVMEGLWLWKKDRLFYRHARFWSRFFLLSMVIGVSSGIPLEFEFGANWAAFAKGPGAYLGEIFGFEATLAFALEAGFLGIMAFGWGRVPPLVHFFSTCMVSLGTSLSAFWIMSANAWMQTPAGGYFADGKFILTDRLAAIFNPDMPYAVNHMYFAAIETALFFVGGISAWYLLKGREKEFFLKSFKFAAAALIAIAPLQVLIGDFTGVHVEKTQPEKMAAMEAHWETNSEGTGAPWKILALPDEAGKSNLWEIEVPYALSLILKKSPTGQVRGLNDFPGERHPPVLVPFYSFRLMVGAGFFLAFLALWTAWDWRRGLHALEGRRRRLLMYAWIAAIPASFAALEAGWVLREAGRQPWIIYGVMKTSEAVSSIQAGHVLLSLAGFAAVYTVLISAFFLFARRILISGPSDSPDGY